MKRSAFAVFTVICLTLVLGLVTGCGNCKHVYFGECDAVCEKCGHERNARGEHVYHGECDSTCDVCGERRTATGEHIYTSACDTVCDCCYSDRIAETEHIYENSCDWNCLLCGTWRSGGGHDFSGDYTYNGDGNHTENGTENLLCGKCGFAKDTRTAENTKGHCFDKDGRCTDCGWSFPDLSLYMAYESFEALPFYNVSYYSNSGNTMGALKIGEHKYGVSYSILSRVCEGNTDLRYLSIFRAESDNSSGNDGFLDIMPLRAGLDTKHTIEFDIMIGSSDGANIYLTGRKQLDGENTAYFNQFILYKASSGQLCAGDRVICDNFAKGVWHKIAITVDDSRRAYDVYVDGELVLSAGRYADADYPSADRVTVGLYRITMVKGTALGEFCLDNIAVYNGGYIRD